ncbi:unnamed protein product, partial [Iphiclides podalirius]
MVRVELSIFRRGGGRPCGVGVRARRSPARLAVSGAVPVKELSITYLWCRVTRRRFVRYRIGRRACNGANGDSHPPLAARTRPSRGRDRPTYAFAIGADAPRVANKSRRDARTNWRGDRIAEPCRGRLVNAARCRDSRVASPVTAHGWGA